MATQKRVLPQWIQNARAKAERGTECHVFLCADIDELVEMSSLFNSTMSAGSGLEDKLRAVCVEKGIEFSPLMQAACEQASKSEQQDIPSLDAQFAAYGGLTAFLDTYAPPRPTGATEGG